MKNKTFFTFILLSFFSTLFYTKVFSQSVDSTSIPSQITELDEQIYVNMTPSSPKANEAVKISLEAYGTDLTKAEITWKINDVTAQSGRGLIELDTTAGNEGTSKKINISITPSNGNEINKSITIAPEKVDLVWEATTYTPPFYKGKALYTSQGKVVIAAFPNFKSDGSIGIDTKHLTYNWLNDNDAVSEYSGYGKDSMIYQGTILLNPRTITALVTSDTASASNSFVNLAPIQPAVLVYENSPLYGVLFNNALPTSFYLNSSEMTLIAYPYNFGFKWLTDPNTQYTWSMNGEDIPNSTQPSMVFKNTSKEAGQTTVGINVKSSSNFLVEANQSLNISFGAGSNSTDNSSSF